MLTREQILSHKNRRIEKISIPEWGGDVYIRSMTAAERDAFEMAVTGGQAPTAETFINARAKLLVLCLCDESGQLLFQEHEASELGQLPAKAVSRLWDIAASMNGFSKESLETLLKN